MEKELFTHMALCVDPRKVAASGLSKRVARSFGIGVSNLSSKERERRQAQRLKLFKTLKPMAMARGRILPGLGPHPGFSDQMAVDIPNSIIQGVAGKIVRGCEYVLGCKRIIDPPYGLRIYFAYDSQIPDFLALFNGLEAITVGPGFVVKRGSPPDEPEAAVYRVCIWDSWVIYGVILPEEELLARETGA